MLVNAPPTQIELKQHKAGRTRMKGIRRKASKGSQMGATTRTSEVIIALLVLIHCLFAAAVYADGAREQRGNVLVRVRRPAGVAVRIAVPSNGQTSAKTRLNSIQIKAMHRIW